ncbi:MAG TPA: tetratricopeptide repeat protein [Longimicrobiales bacterium]|nr:tetratricopeptide repeat protein [Longimicrobiales bacterium]
MRKTVIVLAVFFLVLFGVASRYRLGCPSVGNGATARGWAALRAGKPEAARREFEAARQRCPAHVGARTGLGYVALRAGREREAAALFDAVLATDANAVDALVGRGMLAWRSGDLQRVHDLFERVLKVDPSRPEAREYLAQLPEGFGPAPARPPLVVPDTTVYWSRAAGSGFEVRTARGWAPFYVKGVNLGPALPGKHPSEFPDSATYAEWLRGIGEMGANTIRVYTIHPPRFYQALAAYNASHEEAPLRLIHGVWAEVPPGDDYDDATWKSDFEREMRNVVDLLHGRADIAPRLGHAGGHYTADVSRWTLAYIIGREWEPHSVQAYEALRPAPPAWTGTYLRVAGGNAMDVWLARECDYLVAYEMGRYRAQRPSAYTNWPTLDPLHHPTESTAQEEAALRRKRGEDVGAGSAAFADDAVALDASLVSPTAAYPAGYFASYHIYPYAPDFMGLDPVYAKARSPYGTSSYFGYLQDLKRHHAGLPVLVSEYGVPASLGIAHVQPGGWHHGGHTEAEMAALDARMTREIAAAGMAGGIVFSWIDEWFKKNWLTRPFAIPLERNRLWLNVMDPEQRYGVVAMEAGPAGAERPLAERLGEWRSVQPLYVGEDGATLRAEADEAYLRVFFERGRALRMPSELMVGFDVSRADAGAVRWPGRVGAELPVGVEMVLRVAGGEARVVGNPAADPFSVLRMDGGAVGGANAGAGAGATARSTAGSNANATANGTLNGTAKGTANAGGGLARLKVVGEPAGFFLGRWSQRMNFPMVAGRREDGVYEGLRVVTNRVRLGRDGVEYPAMGYDRGVLRRGVAPDGVWEMDEADGAVEVRIPWTLLNVTDPSSRRVLRVGGPAPKSLDEDDALATEVVEGIRIVAATRGADGGWKAWPRSGKATDVALFGWPTWEQPRWHARRRPTYEALRAAFAGVGGAGGARTVAVQ